MKKNTVKKSPAYDYEKYTRNVMEAVKGFRAEPVKLSIRGNGKTGADIPAFNIPPLMTCPGGCKTCGNDGCYAVKNALRAGYEVAKSSVLKSWARNFAAALYHLDILADLLDKYFSKKTAPRFFRIHSAGDFFSPAYMAMWARIAKRHPETKFLAFTKSFAILQQHDSTPGNIPFWQIPNFSMVVSAWPGMDIPADLTAHYRVAWMQDGTEDRVPADAMSCPGSCDDCGLCWELKNIGRDVCFLKH